MMKRRTAGIALWVALAAAPAFGQGCAMCSSGVHASGEKGQKAMSRAIGVLMVTTLGMIGGLALLVYKTRNGGQDSLEDETTRPGSFTL